MRWQRHGCGGARIGSKVYIVGGEYVNSRSTGSSSRPSEAEVFDLNTNTWSQLSISGSGGPLAFAPVAAVDGRLLVLQSRNNVGLLVFHPQFAVRGFVCTTRSNLSIGSAMCSTTWNDRMMVVAEGRYNDATRRNAGPRPQRFAAFAFEHSSAELTASALQSGHATGQPAWSRGIWCLLGAIFPNQQAGGVGCSLTVVHDRLVVTGGCREVAGAQFSGASLMWGGAFADVEAQMIRFLGASEGRGGATSCVHPFVAAPDLSMVTPMHAHTVFPMPLLSGDTADDDSEHD